MCGETFWCETCHYGEGDGNYLCEGCAELCCKNEAVQEQGNIHADTSLLYNLTTGCGVYTDVGKFARVKNLQSTTVKKILNLIVKNPTILQELLPDIREIFVKKGRKRNVRSSVSSSTSTSSSSSSSSSSPSSSSSSSSSSSPSNNRPKKKMKVIDLSRGQSEI